MKKGRLMIGWSQEQMVQELWVSSRMLPNYEQGSPIQSDRILYKNWTTEQSIYYLLALTAKAGIYDAIIDYQQI